MLLANLAGANPLTAAVVPKVEAAMSGKRTGSQFVPTFLKDSPTYIRGRPLGAERCGKAH